MDVLLREIEKADGRQAYRDTEIAASVVTVGSAPDQLIQLLGEDVAPRHAELRVRDDVIEIRCRARRRLRHNGRSLRTARPRIGDEIEIGGNQLDLIEPPPGFDLALEFRPDRDLRPGAFEAAFTTDLEQTWLKKRGPGYTLLALTLLVGLGLPGAYALLEDERDRWPAWLLGHAIWSSGPLTAAHELALGDECDGCHAPFVRVSIEACAQCHRGIADHVTIDTLAVADRDPQRCASCHLEHDESSGIILRANALCTDCHIEPAAFGAHLAQVTGFSLTTHPTFEVHVASAAGEAIAGEQHTWRHGNGASHIALEPSNLKFPHDLHLDASRVRKPSDSAGLACRDCHRLSADREHFDAITMERDCRACHELTFDPSAPDRQLPHGEPVEVALAIEAHYLRTYSTDDAQTSARVRRRRPDRDRETPACTESAFECARVQATLRVESQFARSGCITCHRVEDLGGSDFRTRFQVLPVKLAGDYFRKARFDHVDHLTQAGVSGDEACMSCHPAELASTSDVLLLPDLEQCIECHSDEPTIQSVPLNCVGCHDYHPRSRPL